MADKNIDDVFAEILKDCKKVAVQVVKNAAKKTQNDILKEADNYLQRYYNNYKPKRYKRTYQLHKLIVPVFNDKTKGDMISIEVGVEYNSYMLKGLYESNSRFHQSGDVWKRVTDYSHVTSDNGIPQPEWIMGNFLEGVHPWAQDDSESTNSLMEEFFEMRLPHRINQYVQEELFNAIYSKL